MELTYRNLIKPIPAKYSLSSVTLAPALKTCDFCRVAVPDRAKAKRNVIETPFERIDTYPEFQALKSSARDGCGLCWIIRKHMRSSWAVRPMEEWGVGPLDENDDLSSDLLHTRWDGKVRFFNLKFTFNPLLDGGGAAEDESACFKQEAGMVTAMTLEFGPVTPDAAEDGSYLHGEISQILGFKVFDSVDLNVQDTKCRRMLPDEYTLSDRNIKMMQSWIKECESRHTACRLPSQTAWLPTRLLDIGPRDGPLLRVIETDDMSTRDVAYAALSHMWGDIHAAPPLQTMGYNRSEIEQGIPIHKLSRNFADAVETCWCLGLRYLWIDSLCILQDSASDWKQQAQTMHLVYKYAKVTIVATSATSSHDGFLARDLSMVPAVHVQYVAAETDNTLILTPVNDKQEGLRRGDIDGSKWNTRGWTMQERALSTRSIHFCRNKIYYECRSCFRSEENEPEQAQSLDPFQLWPRSPQSASYDENKWYERWRKAVTEYSRRRLTMQSDKLMAIRSIANEMANHFAPDSYLEKQATWRGNIANELLWYVESGIPRKVPDSLGISSWSWASLNADIGFVRGRRNVAEPKESVSGIPFDARYSSINRRLYVTGFLANAAEIRPVNDQHFKRASFPYDILGGLNNKLFAHGMLDLDNRNNMLGTPDTDIYYFHIADDQRPSGLLLKRHLETSLSTTHEFERVGVATIFHLSGSLIDPEMFAKTITVSRWPAGDMTIGGSRPVYDLRLI